MTAGVPRAFRPDGMDGTTWSGIRRQWNAAAEHPGRTVELRKALATTIGMTYERLGRWARRCGWLRQHRNIFR